MLSCIPINRLLRFPVLPSGLTIIPMFFDLMMIWRIRRRGIRAMTFHWQKRRANCRRLGEQSVCMAVETSLKLSGGKLGPGQLT